MKKKDASKYHILKIFGWITGIAGILLAAGGTLFLFFLEKKVSGDLPAVGIIGGADEPTLFFQVSQMGGGFAAIEIIIGIVLIVVSGILLTKYRSIMK